MMRSDENSRLGEGERLGSEANYDCRQVAGSGPRTPVPRASLLNGRVELESFGNPAHTVFLKISLLRD